MLSAASLPGPYVVGEYAWEVAGMLTSKAPVAPYRGVGFTAAQTIREMLLDDLARAAGIDRMELRRRTLLDGAPTTSVTGQAYDGGSYGPSFERALELVGYEGWSARQAAAREEGRLLGLGVTPFIEMTSMGTRSAMQSGIHIFSHDNARVSIDLSGKITAAVGTCSHGQGHHTAFAQVAADAFGVHPDDVLIVDGDTGRTPWGMGTFASRSAVFGTGTILKAAGLVRDKLLRVASLLLEAPPEALECADGFVGIRGVPEARIPLADLAGGRHFDPGVRAALGDPTLSATAFFDTDPTYSNGAIAAEVEVDPRTGAVRVERIVAVEDCGTMLNPALVDGRSGRRSSRAWAPRCSRTTSTTRPASRRPRRTWTTCCRARRMRRRSRSTISRRRRPHTPAGVKGMAEGSVHRDPRRRGLRRPGRPSRPAAPRSRQAPLTPSAVWEALQAPAGTA
jgi:carbon-monoxide dehydrogenase large subunit